MTISNKIQSYYRSRYKELQQEKPQHGTLAGIERRRKEMTTTTRN